MILLPIIASRRRHREARARAASGAGWSETGLTARSPGRWSVFRVGRSARKARNQNLKSALEVTIAGQRYVLRGDAGEERLAAIAHIVSETMERVKEAARTASSERVAILTALNLAEELYRQRDEFDATREAITQRTERLIACLKSLAPIADGGESSEGARRALLSNG